MKHLIIAALFLFMISCNGKNTAQEKITQEDAEEVDHHMHDTDEELTEDTDNTEEADVLSEQDLEKFKSISAEMADKLVNAYLKIKDALVNTNSKEAKEAATEIHKELESAEGDAISMLRDDIEHIASTESVQHQREHFNTLSKHMYALVKANDAATKSTLYRQYCPMAFDNTGAFWLSSSEEIRNPYFGDKMLKCGNVEETLN